MLPSNDSAAASSSASSSPWQPVAGQLLTRFAAQVDPACPLPEYPRPQMVRDNWTNLNGLWDYAITPEAAPAPATFDGQILVPFAVESALSGVKKSVLPDQRLHYRRSFDATRPPAGGRLILHFGAVDYDCAVTLNGSEIARHTGGNTPFSIDITDALADGGRQTLALSVWDPTDTQSQPRGKQQLKPDSIWYTPVTGIHQTVWTEVVPACSIQRLKITPDVDGGEVVVRVITRGAKSAKVTIDLDSAGGASVCGDANADLRLKVPNAKLWAPGSPHLYDLTVSLTAVGGESDSASVGGISNASDNTQVDTVRSYFAMRKITLGPGPDGVLRMLLNDTAVFQYGPLDQGWWPDGLLTPPSEEAIRFDLEATAAIGFNMIRKHIKVEPDRWYHWCDKLGLLVWQDMPSGMVDKVQSVRPEAQADAPFTDAQKQQYRYELKEMIDHLHNHPCVVVWVPFNEGWGQHDTNDILKWTMDYDPSRLIDGPSGWTDRGVGHMLDMHHYPGPGMLPAQDGRASVLGEFGGLGLPVQGHLWRTDRNWGYRTYDAQERLKTQYALLVRKLRPLIEQGLSAAVYTQTTDVEGEINGLITYDREHFKMPAEWLSDLHQPLYAPPRGVTRVTIVPTSEHQPQTWSHAAAEPPATWTTPAFDAARWPTAPGAFGLAPDAQPDAKSDSRPDAAIRSPFPGEQLWLRRSFTLANQVQRPHLRLRYGEEVRVYIDGELVFSEAGWINEYVEIPLDPDVRLAAGEHTLAVTAKKTKEATALDVGLVDYQTK